MVHFDVDSARVIRRIERVAFCWSLIERHPIRLSAYERFMTLARARCTQMLASASKLEQIVVAGTGTTERMCDRLARETKGHVISSIATEAWMLTGRSGSLSSG